MKDPNTCSHSRDTSRYVEWEDDWTGEMRGEWEYSSESTMEDFDLHRTRCTRCGHIGYYSSAARNYFERGITSPVNGLDGQS